MQQHGVPYRRLEGQQCLHTYRAICLLEYSTLCNLNHYIHSLVSSELFCAHYWRSRTGPRRSHTRTATHALFDLHAKTFSWRVYTPLIHLDGSTLLPLLLLPLTQEGSMQSSDPSTRVVPALPTDKGFWGQTKRVLIGDGVEIGRLCPRCGEFSAFKRTKFLETHGVHADGTPKCTSLDLQQPPPESAAAAATAAGGAEPVAAATAAAGAARLQGGPAAAAGPAAGGNAGEADHEGARARTWRTRCLHA